MIVITFNRITIIIIFFNNYKCIFIRRYFNSSVIPLLKNILLLQPITEFSNDINSKLKLGKTRNIIVPLRESISSEKSNSLYILLILLKYFGVD